MDYTKIMDDGYQAAKRKCGKKDCPYNWKLGQIMARFVWLLGQDNYRQDCATNRRRISRGLKPLSGNY